MSSVASDEDSNSAAGDAPTFLWIDFFLGAGIPDTSVPLLAPCTYTPAPTASATPSHNSLMRECPLLPRISPVPAEPSSPKY